MRHTTLRKFIAACMAGTFVSACCFVHPFFRQETRPLTYRYHTSIPSTWVGPIDSAANSWNASYPMFRSGGGGGGPTYSPDNINSIFRYAFVDSRILAAVDFPILNLAGVCRFRDTDMGWSNNSFSTTGAAGTYYVQTVALHEFGHYGWLGHVSCPSNAIMLPSYQGVRRNPSGCDRLGMTVSNVISECYAAMGLCRISLFSLSSAFEDMNEESQAMVDPFQEHRDELLQIWDGDTALQSASDSVGSFYDQMADDWRNGLNTPYYQPFTLTRYNELNSQIIARVYQSASTPLRADLDALRQHLQSKIGLSLGAIFLGDIHRWEPANDPDGDCEPTGTEITCSN